jgi:hypothetical protein
VQELRAVLSAMEWRARREETSKTMPLASRLLSSFTEEHGAGTPVCAVRHVMARTARRNKQDNAAVVSFALKMSLTVAVTGAATLSSTLAVAQAATVTATLIVDQNTSLTGSAM